MVTSVGLPLLMVNGKFQNLGSMTVEDLETFIPFLVKCSINRAGAQVVNGVPEWWSSVIQYKFPLQKPYGLSVIGYRRHLASIVCRCYWYHDAQFLLPFCSEIANSPDSVFLESNEDNTTSIFYVHNTIQILRFNNENKNYDKEFRYNSNGKNFRRYLLPSLPKIANIPDIYLCENCDAEFSSHTEMQKHEKVCFEVVIDVDEDDDKNSNCSDSFREVEVLKHLKPVSDKITEKNNFFSYFQLSSSNCFPIAQQKPKKNTGETFSKRWVNADLCLHKNRDIEFSSLSGRKMLEHNIKRDLMTKIERSLGLIESYCCNGAKTHREKEVLDFKVTYKTKGKKSCWTHQYSFGKKQRTERYKTLLTGLDERSRKLLKKCKNLSIVLTRIKLSS